MKLSLFFLALCLGLFSCQQIDMAEKNLFITGKSWNSADSLSHTINIEDTNALYNISVVLRHTDNYSYNNIWLLLGLQAPGQPMEYRQVNIPLATDATGWFGSGMDDIWESRHLISKNRRFSQPGEFKFVIKQIMRDDPLKNMISAGLRVEKSTGNGAQP